MQMIKKSQREKVAIILYLIITNKSASLYSIRKRYEEDNDSINYNYFKKYYEEALLLLNKYNGKVESQLEIDIQEEKIIVENSTQIEPKVMSQSHQSSSEETTIQTTSLNQEVDEIIGDDYFEVPVDEMRALFNKDDVVQQITPRPISQSTHIQEHEVEYPDINDDEEIEYDFTNVDAEIPDIAQMISNTQEATHEDIKENVEITTPIDISKVKLKEGVHREAIKVEDIKEDKGFVFLEKYNESIWYDIDKYKIHLSKEGYQEERDDYKMHYFKNMVLMNVLANKEIEQDNPIICDFMKENGIVECEFGASRIHDINNEYSNFKYLSKEYPDFIDSKYIQDKEYFEIIMEWEEGSATRNYLDKFIGKIKREVLEDYDGVSDEQIDLIIDGALLKWKRDEQDVKTRSDCFQFIQNQEVSSLFKEENTYMPYSLWFNIQIPLRVEDGVEVFKDVIGDISDITKVLLRTNHEQIKKLLTILKKDDALKEMWVTEIYKLNLDDYNSSIEEAYKHMIIFIKDAYTQTHRIYVREYMKDTAYTNLLSLQDRWIFEYNMEILETKKNIIISELESEAEIIIKNKHIIIEN